MEGEQAPLATDAPRTAEAPATDEPRTAEASATDEPRTAEASAKPEQTAEASAKPQASRQIRWIARLTLLVVCLGLGELGVRIAGQKPWDPDLSSQDNFKVVPGPGMFSRDDEIGHALQPGKQTITYGTGPTANTWIATHLDKYRRLTRPGDMPPPPADAKTLWFFGDSFTYGGSINDAEAYPYRVQVKHPELSVVDYAWPGQSSIQTLLLLKKLISSGEKPPDVAFMGYASFHDGRTLMARGNRKAWHSFRTRFPTFPAARLDDGKLVWEQVRIDYDPLPLEQYSALMSLIATYYNKADVVLSHGKEVSQAVIEEVHSYCKEKGVRFVLLGIHHSPRTRDVIRWAPSRGMQSADISVDESNPDNVVKGDGHPNGNATRQFAEKLEPVIKEALAAPP